MVTAHVVAVAHDAQSPLHATDEPNSIVAVKVTDVFASNKAEHGLDIP